ncbi:hypothetical protein Adt_41804 [Abeliophyllum distichum]|uniref:Uncharacterized protein n=1 Tax=Abeliophyllum distichum TaxID=126358 RepID=A0ABD1PRF9_9LAMI
MDINDRHFDDPDSDDEDDNHLSKMSTILVRFLSSPVMILQKREMVTLEQSTSHAGDKFAAEGGFHFSKIPVFKIRDRRVTDERGTPHPILLAPSMAPNLMSTVLPVVEVVGGVSSLLSTSSVAPIPVAIVLLVMEVGDD